MVDNVTTKPSQQDVHDSFGALYQELTNAYWYATTIEDKDRIRGIADSVFEILTALNRADIQSRTDEFKALVQTVGEVNKRLDKLKQDIDGIIHVVKVATSVAGAIDKVLEKAAKFFPM